MISVSFLSEHIQLHLLMLIFLVVVWWCFLFFVFFLILLWGLVCSKELGAIILDLHVPAALLEHRSFLCVYFMDNVSFFSCVPWGSDRLATIIPWVWAIL